MDTCTGVRSESSPSAAAISRSTWAASSTAASSKVAAAPAPRRGARGINRQKPETRRRIVDREKEDTVDHTAELVNRFVAIWNEPDADRRAASVRELWTVDALHFFQPPQEVLDAAAALDVTAVFQARGHAELEARVARAHEQFVAPGEFSFRRRGSAARVGDVVKFSWEMVGPDGQVAAVGLEFLVLAADGRAKLDYQFIET
jgi:hypothetical protein